jgi:phosphoglycerate dehydrogenase-like enzyme
VVLHGANAAAFAPGFAELIGPQHQLVLLPDDLGAPADRGHFTTADVLIGIRFTASMPRPARLRLYQVPGAGIDGIDRASLPPTAVLCNCFGHEDAIAEYVMSILLARHVPFAAADRDLRQGKWTYWAGNPHALHSEMSGTTIGLLGFGHIGRAVAQRAKSFGMTVIVANRSPVAASGLIDRALGLDALEEFMGSADAIVVSLPLAKETRGLIGSRELAAMRRHGFIINVGRGPVIDEQALYQALAERRIGGAAIDTWYVYPQTIGEITHPSRLAFNDLDNVVLTPHMSGWTHGTIRRRQQAMADNIARLQRGEPLVNVV